MSGELLKSAAGRRGIVLLAGAGVSAGKPSALPGWYATNRAIAEVLALRLETALGRPGWLAAVLPLIHERREAGGFPPDYQAQLIEERCGERYFRALTALDVATFNGGHAGIAALAAGGAVRAVVTTNFDRLIERALDERGVSYQVACDDRSYLSLEPGGPLPVIKIHGCVSDPASMIDTLKQRRRGRSRAIHECLRDLLPEYWIYLGFSAADLEADPEYLGMVAAARNSAGGMFVSYPGSAGLGKGAIRLMEAYGDRGKVVVTETSAFLTSWCDKLGIKPPREIPAVETVGPAEFRAKLGAWADGLSASATGVCLAGILEAVGQAEAAVRVLDRVVRKQDGPERLTADYWVAQLHYGRLGAAWGRFVNVPDLNGNASNASVETTQSLLRLIDSECGFVAAALLACQSLWNDDGNRAMGIATQVIRGLSSGEWEGLKPASDEEAVDGWLVAAQVCIINAHPLILAWVAETAPVAWQRAIHCGDVVRAARVAALRCLALAEGGGSIAEVVEIHRQDFADAARVGDGVVAAMLALAEGRWRVGASGLAVAGGTDGRSIAEEALGFFNNAVKGFESQGMDPWRIYSIIQRAKALADLQRFEFAQECIDVAAAGVERFPVFASHLHEAVGQIQTMFGSEAADASFAAAIATAEESGLLARHALLVSNYQKVTGDPSGD